MESKKILVSLTSLAAISENNLTGWRSKIEEIRKFGLEEIALFLTGLKEEEREYLYKELKKTQVKSIPHVHLRTDMELQELDYLFRKYNIRAFNLHSTSGWPLLHDYQKYFPIIYLENTRDIPDENELNQFGGLCIDFAHWERRSLENNREYCSKMKQMAENYKIGCAHISAIKDKPTPIVINKNILKYDSHELENMKELDYIKKYKKYLPNIISIELENSIEKQLEAKKYIEKIISDN